ncbi:MAG: ABC transporter permease [Rhodobacteraceae bacterium]|nr:ABC transporter permease [Paracoccaceae bacterium]
MADVGSVAGVAPKTVHRRQWPGEVNVLIGLVVIALVFEVLGWIQPAWRSDIAAQSFLFNKLRLSIIIGQVAITGIIAVGVTQVIITGGIDLSSGSVVGAAAMIGMSFAQASTYSRAVYPHLTDMPIIVPAAVAILCGAVAGFVNGGLVAYTKIPSFIATLGMMVTARGVANWYTKGQPISFPTDGYTVFGSGLHPVMIFVGLAVLFHLALRFTLYGNRTYAIGSNEEAARVSGINVERHLLLVYTIAGALAGVAALVLTSKNLTAQAGMGVMYELDAIAMAVIGGVSLSGGRGSIIGTVLGALIFGVITSGFTFLGIDAYYQQIIKGAIIVIAVIADVARQKRAARRA